MAHYNIIYMFKCCDVMKRMMNIEATEMERLYNTIDVLRSEKERLNIEVKKLEEYINTLKNTGDNVLVVNRSNDGDAYEYMSQERIVLCELVKENSKIREKCNDIYDMYNKEMTQRIQSECENNKNVERIIKLEEYINDSNNKNIIGKIFGKTINLER